MLPRKFIPLEPIFLNRDFVDVFNFITLQLCEMSASMGASRAREGGLGVTQKTHDDLTRRPVFCFLTGRKDVGVAARDPMDELPSPVKDKAIGESFLSASSWGRLLADRVARVATLAARDWRVLLVFLTGVVSRSASASRTELSCAPTPFVTLRASRRRSQNESSSSSGI